MSLASPPTLADLVRIATEKGFAADAVQLALLDDDGRLDNLMFTEIRPHGAGVMLVLHGIGAVLEEAERKGYDLDTRA